jgi:hypothetical protein
LCAADGRFAVTTLSDGVLERLFWHVLRQSAKVVGPLRARAVAATVLRLLARSDCGYCSATLDMMGR